jgi:hypothetical protein
MKHLTTNMSVGNGPLLGLAGCKQTRAWARAVMLPGVNKSAVLTAVTTLGVLQKRLAVNCVHYVGIIWQRPCCKQMQCCWRTDPEHGAGLLVVKHAGVTMHCLSAVAAGQQASGTWHAKQCHRDMGTQRWHSSDIWSRHSMGLHHDKGPNYPNLSSQCHCLSAVVVGYIGAGMWHTSTTT